MTFILSAARFMAVLTVIGRAVERGIEAGIVSAVHAFKE